MHISAVKMQFKCQTMNINVQSANSKIFHCFLKSTMHILKTYIYTRPEVVFIIRIFCKYGRPHGFLNEILIFFFVSLDLFLIILFLNIRFSRLLNLTSKHIREPINYSISFQIFCFIFETTDSTLILNSGHYI